MTENSDVTRRKPIAPRVTYHGDTDTLSVTLRHSEADGVSSCTSSFMTQLEMRPEQWLEYVAAVSRQIDDIQRAQAVGTTAADLAERIAGHAAAT